MKQDHKVKIGLALLDTMIHYQDDIEEMLYSQDEDFDVGEWVPPHEILEILHQTIRKLTPKGYMLTKRTGVVTMDITYFDPESVVTDA